MAAFDEFKEILAQDEPLGKLTCFGVGGPAEWLAHPRNVDELSRLVRRCRAEDVPFRVFGGGSNILLPDEGVKGMVIRMTSPDLQKISVKKTQVTAGAGAMLAELIAESSKASASGLEPLVGIPGTVGGALRQNAGGRAGDIGQHVASIDVLDEQGELSTRMRADIRFSYRQSNLDDAIIVGAQFELVEDNPHDIVQRIKKLWIATKANQPFGFQSAGYAFRSPRGLSAVDLIDKAGLRGFKVGGAEVCTRDPKFIIANPGATSRDIHRLIDLVRSKVEERTGVVLELQLDIW